jgi:hypothetical protein
MAKNKRVDLNKTFLCVSIISFYHKNFNQKRNLKINKKFELFLNLLKSVLYSKILKISQPTKLILRHNGLEQNFFYVIFSQGRFKPLTTGSVV